MDHERKELLAQKKAQFKVKQQREDIQQYKNRCLLYTSDAADE